MLASLLRQPARRIQCTIRAAHSSVARVPAAPHTPPHVGTAQAPNRAVTWSKSQAARIEAMVGPRFEQTAEVYQPRPLAAVELIQDEPIRLIQGRVAACDGGGGALGHPRIFINIDKEGPHSCTYCGIRYEKDHHHHGHGKPAGGLDGTFSNDSRIMSDIDDIISGRGVASVGADGQPQALPSSFDAENAQNDEGIEQQFAVMCMEQAETYFKLVTKIKPSTLPRLTKWDDEIMEAFEKAFPDYQSDERLRVLSEDEMKSPEGKKRWREFMMPFEKKIDEYNFGTLIRLNCEDDYTQQNSMFGYRLQFYAIEIARNRRGLNDKVWQLVQDDPTRFQ
ncbi:hypothetical protein JCM10207_007017 [Rhodosporidiobolus poonsookiae]